MTNEERAKRRENIANDLKAKMPIGDVIDKYKVSYSLVYSIARSSGCRASLSVRTIKETDTIKRKEFKRKKTLCDICLRPYKGSHRDPVSRLPRHPSCIPF